MSIVTVAGILGIFVVVIAIITAVIVLFFPPKPIKDKRTEPSGEPEAPTANYYWISTWLGFFRRAETLGVSYSGKIHASPKIGFHIIPGTYPRHEDLVCFSYYGVLVTELPHPLLIRSGIGGGIPYSGSYDNVIRIQVAPEPEDSFSETTYQNWKVVRESHVGILIPGNWDEYITAAAKALNSWLIPLEKEAKKKRACEKEKEEATQKAYEEQCRQELEALNEKWDVPPPTEETTND